MSKVAIKQTVLSDRRGDLASFSWYRAANAAWLRPSLGSIACRYKQSRHLLRLENFRCFSQTIGGWNRAALLNLARKTRAALLNLARKTRAALRNRARENMDKRRAWNRDCDDSRI